MNITFVGGGNMARALLGGLIARGHGSEALAVVEIDPETRATVAARFGVATFAAIEPAAVGRADVIVIATANFSRQRFRETGARAAEYTGIGRRRNSRVVRAGRGRQ